MNRIFLVAALLLLGMTPTLATAAKTQPPDKNCVPDQGCPKGMHPPKCCKPPPCEFLDALQQARAKNVLYQAELTKSVFYDASDSSGDDLAPLAPVKLETDYEKFKEKVNKAMKKARKQFPKCRTRKRIPDPPIFSVMEDDECRIKTYVGGEFKELSYDQAQAASNSCSELVDAKWDAALNRQSDCNLSKSENDDDKDRANRRGHEFKAEYQSLLSAMQQYWSRCSIKSGSKIAREVAARGIDDLKFNPPKTPKKKGPPKKSGKKGR